MDPFELLKRDHQTVSKLFDRIESTSGEVRLSRFRKLKEELDLHADIEEKIFYPALKDAQESRDITLEAYEEHKVIKDLLGELARAKTPSDEWVAKFTVLRENVEHHVDEEEGELFKKAKSVLSSEEAEALGNKMAAEKERRGSTIPKDLKKPGLIKTVVNALFGDGADKQGGKKKAATKSAEAKSVKTAAAKKSAKQSPAKRGKKRAKTATTATKTTSRKTTSKRSKGKAKA